MSEPIDVVVRAGDCPCPGTPHTEEHVFLEPELTTPMAAGAMAALNAADATIADHQTALIESYLPRGIRSWSFLEADENGRIVSVPINRANLARLLPWNQGGFDLAERADSLYSETLLRPWVARMSMLSQRGQTGDTTPPNQAIGRPPRKPSRRSLPNGGAGRLSAAQDQ